MARKLATLCPPSVPEMQEKGIAKLATAQEDHPAIKRAYALLQDAFEQVKHCGWLLLHRFVPRMHVGRCKVARGGWLLPT